MSEETFSQRRGLASQDIPIAIHNEAPQWLRDFIVTAAQKVGMGSGDLREILCARLLESPDLDNWSAGNIEREVRCLLRGAEWFHVYDFIEDVAAWFRQNKTHFELDGFTHPLNESFRKKGVGWQLVGAKIETRGEESFETSVRSAIATATEMAKPVAAKELHEALQDLSKRPDPDITGAIQHAMAALECVARDVTGDVNATFGELLKNNPGTLPPPLDNALSKIWGFASDRARHLRENQPPPFEEAELVVGLAGALSTYLLKKLSKDDSTRH